MLLFIFTCYVGLCLCQESTIFLEEPDEHHEDGPPQLDGRIVGGQQARISQFPYQISLQFDKKHICGGAIIAEEFILTAAHCVVKGAISRFTIRAGSTYNSHGGVTSKVCSIKRNGFYNNRTQDSDVAVFKLCDSLKFGDKIKKISLPPRNQELSSGTTVIVTGWGYTAENSGYISDVLRKVQVPIVERSQCMKLYRGEGTVTGNMICAGLTQGGKDSCQGDSGGPLVLDGKIVGIVSWGYGCARPGYPGVYTKVANYINFIRKNAKLQ